MYDSVVPSISPEAILDHWNVSTDAVPPSTYKGERTLAELGVAAHAVRPVAHNARLSVTARGETTDGA
jgi:hypothetical protein